MAQDTSTSTAHYAFPLPNPGNKLRADVQRLMDATNAIDGELNRIDETAAELQQKANALDAGKVEKVNGQAAKEITLRREDLSLGPANGATVVAITYNAEGRVATVVETVDGNSATATYTYNGDGTVKTIATLYKGRTRTETYAYSGGKVTGITATEVQA